jgi:hypothetical protein
MEWALGITDGISFVAVLGSLVIFTLFLTMLTIYIFTNPKTKDEGYIVCVAVSFLIAYFTCAYIVTLEINDASYKALQERIEPFKDDAKIKELLEEAKKDGKISTAERDRLNQRAYDIANSKHKQDLFEQGSVAKKELIGQ